MKILLFILILAGLTFIGYCFSKKYKDRIAFYKEFNMFCNVLENQISFTKNSISSIAGKYYPAYKSKFKKVLSDVLINKNKYEKLDILNEQENNYAENFFNSLGKLDVKGEILNIKNNKSEITEKINECTQDDIKYGNLGIKLGFILGLLICIILI